MADAPRPTLVSLRDAAERHVLAREANVVGRSGDCDVRIAHPDMSRRHARLVVREADVRVEDLGSKNGVFVDGRRVVEPVSAGHGAQIAFGDLIYRLEHPAGLVAQALDDAGEPTVTRTVAPPPVTERETARTLLVPAIVAILLAVAVLLTLL